ncbi:MAG: hypothetical protein NW241_14260 [Bacteroidia bacterium]|nr:hypothetical protein [Bacteroidia bacterium]
MHRRWLLPALALIWLSLLQGAGLPWAAPASAWLSAPVITEAHRPVQGFPLLALPEVPGAVEICETEEEPESGGHLLFACTLSRMHQEQAVRALPLHLHADELRPGAPLFIRHRILRL